MVVSIRPSRLSLVTRRRIPSRASLSSSTALLDHVDRERRAGFVVTIGMLSGALASGLENGGPLRHIALFRDRP